MSRFITLGPGALRQQKLDAQRLAASSSVRRQSDPITRQQRRSHGRAMAKRRLHARKVEATKARPKIKGVMAVIR